MNEPLSISLRPEEETDYRVVENLTREAFWDLYHPGCTEHLVVNKMRRVNAFVRELDFVACDGNIVVGNIVYSKARVIDENRESEVLCMGPVSVLPAYQNKGIGSMLMNHSIQKAKELGYRAVIIFGNPGYYHRFGFVNAEKFRISTSGGDNFDPFMALELYPGALDGITGRFFEDEVFRTDDKELEIFEREFPYREKHITDSQLK